ncbi:MAG: PIN domain-containing protein [Blastocatellia bacterium]
MIIVFDSNVWLSELGLRSAAGAAVRFYLKQSSARVAIPEVVRLEVSHNLSSRLMKHIGNIRSDYSQLLTAFGRLREIALPTEPEVQARIDALFDSLGVEQFEVPFTLESARSSFLKTIHKEPPNSQNSQQFKDGVLWADCVSLLARDSVVLVTADKGFYQDQQYSRGLASNLRDEASAYPNTMRVVPDLSELLESVQTPIDVDGDALQNAFIEAHRLSIEGTLERHGFSLGSRTDLSFNVFATENSGVLFIDFTIMIQCEDVRGEGRTDAVLRLSGDGSYLPGTREFRNLRNFGEELHFRLQDGSVSEMRNVVAFIDGIVIGHREVSHVTRYRLPKNEP